jgi:hypothetical protein
MNTGQDIYFIVNENNEVSDGLLIEQLANIRLNAKQLVNKNNTEWKEAAQFPELQGFIQQKPSPPIIKPIPPPTMEREVAGNVTDQSRSFSSSNQSRSTSNSIVTDLTDKYNSLEQKQKQYLKYGLVLLLLLFGIYHCNNSNCEADLLKSEQSLTTLSSKLREKRAALTRANNEVRAAEERVNRENQVDIFRTKAQGDKDRINATNNLTSKTNNRNAINEEVEILNESVSKLKAKIEKLQEKCGKE